MSAQSSIEPSRSEEYLERRAASAAFEVCAADASDKEVCGVYYCGPGGQGKTWLLQRIGETYAADERYRLLPIIDFAATEYQSIRGLQAGLRGMLDDTGVFADYDEVVRILLKAEAEDTDESVIAGLNTRAERRFLEALRLATGKRPLILRFDTLERVQGQDVGWWVLQVVLPALTSVRVALAGRPEPGPADVPANVEEYELGGFSIEQTREFLQSALGDQVDDDMVEHIYVATEGRPLLLNLVADAMSERDRRAELLSSLEALSIPPTEEERDAIHEILTRIFAEAGDRLNWVIWAMAALHRRFDIDILRYLIEHGVWFKGTGYEEVYRRLRQYVYVKPNPEQQSHLLHDEIQRLVDTYILRRMTHARSIVAEVQDLIVDKYYPEAIAEAEDAEPGLARQLRAEHLGYVLDRAMKDGEREDALSLYRDLRERAAATHDYGLEELIWREMRAYLAALRDGEAQKQSLYGERGRFLQRHRLFRKMEMHFEDMYAGFQDSRDARVEALLYLSLAQLRLGKLAEALVSIRQCDRLVSADDAATRADLEITWGQIERAAGRWKLALDHYETAVQYAMTAGDMEMLASAYLNRSFVWALQGRYKAARDQCDRALSLLQRLSGPNVAQRQIFAYMNKASAYRYEGEYEKAETTYKRSMALARANNNQEAICDLKQRLGINAYLIGRTARRDVVEENASCTVVEGQAPPECRTAVDDAAERQLEAWDYLSEAFEMAMHTDWRAALASTLHRMAKVYREVHRMQWLLDAFALGDKPAALVELEQVTMAYAMPLELQFEEQLVDERPWEALDWQGRALRLFDLSALLADEANDLHRALDALTELARAAAEAADPEMMQKVWQRIAALRGYDYHRELFEAMNDISRADFHFVQGELDKALTGYKEGYLEVARESGYARFLLLDRLRDLRWRLVDLGPDLALVWLDELQKAWELELKDDDKWPDMLTFLDDTRLYFLREKAQSQAES